jgi:fatty acid desaturase
VQALTIRDLVPAAELARFRARSTWAGVGMVAHAWALILGAMALFAWWPNPLTFLLAVAVIAGRQLGLAVLMHEAAHGGLAKDQRLNMWLGQWLCAFPVFLETVAYRTYHFRHHQHTQGPEDPDLVLSAPFPITRKSLRRKLIRDLTGQTAYQQRKAQFRQQGFKGLWRQFAVNAALFAGLALAGHWYLYPLLWLLPLATWYMAIVRIRNIAEHAMVPANDDPFRNARTTRAGWLTRLFLAPYYVNYHVEHHLLMYVPAYRLPALHRWLMQGQAAGRMEVQPNYAAVLRLATSVPDDEDRRGGRVHDRRKAALAGGF